MNPAENDDRHLVADVLGVEFEDHVDQIDDMFDAVALYRLNKEAANHQPKAATRKAELVELSNALSRILQQKPTDRLMFAGTADYAALLASAAGVQSILLGAEGNEYFSGVLNATLPRGHEPDDRRFLIDRLATLFNEITGARPTHAWDSYRNEYRGILFEVCKILMPEFPIASLGKEIQKSLSARRKEQ